MIIVGPRRVKRFFWLSGTFYYLLVMLFSKIPITLFYIFYIIMGAINASVIAYCIFCTGLGNSQTAADAARRLDIENFHYFILEKYDKTFSTNKLFAVILFIMLIMVKQFVPETGSIFQTIFNAMLVAISMQYWIYILFAVLDRKKLKETLARFWHDHNKI